MPGRRARRAFTVLTFVLALVGGACSGAHEKATGEPAGTATTVPARSGPTALRLTEVWSWPAAPPASGGMPAADADGIALTSGHERLTLLDPTGATRWTAGRQGLREVAPALAAEAVVAATREGVVAFDRASGRLQWEAGLGEEANAPAVVGERVVTTTFEGSLVGIDLASGRVAWRTALGGVALGPPAGAGGLAVAAWDTGHAAGIVAVDARTGREMWSAALPPDGVSAPAVDAATGTVVVVAADRAAHGLSLDDGRERWRRAVGGAGSPEVPPQAIGDGSVLVAHRLGGLAMLDGGDGRVRWTASSGSAAVRGGPVGPGANGWFALPLDDGRLMLAGPDRAVDIREPPALVSGVAAGPGGVLVVGLAQGAGNGASALRGW